MQMNYNLAGQFLSKVNVNGRPMLMFDTREEAIEFFTTHYEAYVEPKLEA